MFNFWDVPEDTPPPPARSAVFVMRNGRYEPQNLMPVLPRPDTLDFDGFVVRRGANAGYMNPRPPEMRQASLFKNPVSVRRDSARTVRPGGTMRRSSKASLGTKYTASTAVADEDKVTFSLTFDALRPGTLTLYAMVTEVERTLGPPPAAVDDTSKKEPQERVLELHARDAIDPASPTGAPDEVSVPTPPTPIEVWRFGDGLSQVYESPPLDTRAWPDGQLSFDPLHPKDIPIAVCVEADDGEDEEKAIQYTYISFQRVPSSPIAHSKERPHWTISIVSQKLQFGPQSFVCHDVFGVTSKLLGECEPEGGNSDCVICLSEPRDTAVLPCRHMCFCSYCAGIVRLQCDRCPICRQKVASLLQFRRNQDREQQEREAILGKGPATFNSSGPAIGASGPCGPMATSLGVGAETGGGTAAAAAAAAAGDDTRVLQH